MRGFRATIPLFFAALVAAGLLQYARWKTFAPEGGNFSIEIPGAGGNVLLLGLGRPERVEAPVDTLVGKVDMVLFRTGHWGKEFAIGYADFPESAGSLTKVEEIFDGAATSIKSRYNGVITKQYRITKGEHPGRHTVMDVETGVGGRMVAYRTFLVDRRLFLLVVAVPKLVGESTSPDIERFFDSFEPTAASADFKAQ